MCRVLVARGFIALDRQPVWQQRHQRSGISVTRAGTEQDASKIIENIRNIQDLRNV